MKGLMSWGVRGSGKGGRDDGLNSRSAKTEVDLNFGYPSGCACQRRSGDRVA